MTGVEVAFGLLGIVAVGSAVLVVTTTRIVHAALWLVLTLGALAGCYLLLRAEFVAWVQVLIYVGAVVVLLLFAVMLTRAPTGPSAELTGRNRWVALVVAAATAGVLLSALSAGWSQAEIDLDAGGATTNSSGRFPVTASPPSSPLASTCGWTTATSDSHPASTCSSTGWSGPGARPHNPANRHHLPSAALRGGALH